MPKNSLPGPRIALLSLGCAKNLADSERLVGDLQASGFMFPWGAGVALPHLAVVGLQVGAFFTKVVVVIWFLMLIRWTLPRFRYDQAMRLGWLALFPLSVLNILVTGLVLLALGTP